MVTANFLFFIIIFFLPPIKTEGVWEHCTIRFKLEREYRAILYNIPQYNIHMPQRRRNKIKMSMHYNNNNQKTENMRTVLSLQAGLLSLDSQTAMAKIGCVTMVDGGMTNKLPLER